MVNHKYDREPKLWSPANGQWSQTRRCAMVDHRNHDGWSQRPTEMRWQCTESADSCWVNSVVGNRRGIIIRTSYYCRLRRGEESAYGRTGVDVMLGYLDSSAHTVRGLRKWPLALSQECLGHLTTHNAPCVSPKPRKWTCMQRQSLLSMPVEFRAQSHRDCPRTISCTPRPCITASSLVAIRLNDEADR